MGPPAAVETDPVSGPDAARHVDGRRQRPEINKKKEDVRSARVFVIRASVRTPA
jgi:hypothetical protein